MTEQELQLKISKMGGKIYLVGGWVRDQLRQVAAKDKDYVITGITEEALRNEFPQAECVGKCFPVYLLCIDDVLCEAALARRECKVSSGYTGFNIEADEHITIEEDLYRRDTTINSIAYDLQTQEYIDPYNGRSDIIARQIRAVSTHFTEDSIRALRAARQAACFDFSIDADTINMMKACAEELKSEPQERLFDELKKALTAKRPSLFFRYLHKAELLKVAYPELYALIGKTQPPQFHPEGDAFEHSMQVVDYVASKTERSEVRFAALVHDIGKGVTPVEMLPHHYGHEKTGLTVLAQLDKRMTLPKLWRKCAEFVIREHMRVNTITKIGKQVDFIDALRKNPIEFTGFSIIVQADNNGAVPEILKLYPSFIKAINGIDFAKVVKNSNGKDIKECIKQAMINACIAQKVYFS